MRGRRFLPPCFPRSGSSRAWPPRRVSSSTRPPRRSWTRRTRSSTRGGAPAFGFGVDFSQARFNPLKLKSGRWPSSENEVAIDAGTADEVGYKVGDMVRVASLGPVRSFRLTGIASYGDQESLGAATFAVFTIPTAQKLFDRKNQFDAIWIAAEPGVAPEKLVTDLEPLLPANAEALTANEQTREDLKQVEFTKFIRYFLLSFAGIALFVGAFVIFNTLSITVAQRVREFATLRTIGASRRQVLTAVTLEALIIGFLASVVGLIGGLFLARGVNALFKAVNADLPTTALNLTTSIVFYSLLLGTLVTLVAGIFPAVRATRVPPIAAVREGATLPASRISKYTPYIALVVVAIAVALLAYGMFGRRDEHPRQARLARDRLPLALRGRRADLAAARPLDRGRRSPDREVADARCRLPRLPDEVRCLARAPRALASRSLVPGAAGARPRRRSCSSS